MNNDEQTWKKACERVGVYPKRRNNLPEQHPDAYYFPPIGDADACMKMLEWLTEFRSRTAFGWDYESNEDAGYWVNNSRMRGGAVHGHKTLPLALAAAVCSVEEK